jgi:enoyl-CoA hydratase
MRSNFTPPRRASGAIGCIKRAVQSGTDVGLMDGLALERELQQLLFQREDAAEGIRASLEKRTAVFKGT